MIKSTITLTHPGHLREESIRGFVTVKVNSATLISNVDVYVEGKTRTHITRRHPDSNSNPIVKDFDEVFYTSPPYSTFDDFHSSSLSKIIELAPGEHSYPFSFNLPTNLPSSLFFPNANCYLKYDLYARVHLKTDEVIISNPYTIPLCLSSTPHTPAPHSFTFNTPNTDIIVQISDTTPTLGDTLHLSMTCMNRTSKTLDITANLVSTHTFRTTVIKMKSDPVSFTSSPPEQSTRVAYLTVPLKMPPTTSTQNFEITNSLEISYFINRKSVIHTIPLIFNIDVTDPLLMSSRAQLFGGKRDFSKVTGFYGIHFRPSPEYSIIQKDVPVGYEHVTTSTSDTYIINHFTRSIISGDFSYPYPLYNSTLLPHGWSMGSEYGETYFIDHNTCSTSWQDPRPNEERVIPHIKLGKTAKFTVEVIEATGLPVLGWGVPDPYVCLLDSDETWKRTDVVKKSLDPSFVGCNNKLEITLDSKRGNVVIYLFDYHRISFDVFMGGVEFDLQYFPQDTVIDDWFGLSCFNNKNNPVTGMVHLKVCYRVNESIRPANIQVCGKTELNEVYYPFTAMIEKQIEKQNTTRKSLGTNKTNPMKVLDGKIVCLI
ncbi:WW domain-containing protein [Entamoeba marina]